MEKSKLRGLKKNEQNWTSTSKVVAFSIKKWCLVCKHITQSLLYVSIFKFKRLLRNDCSNIKLLNRGLQVFQYIFTDEI